MKVVLSRAEKAALAAHPDAVAAITKDVWIPGYGNYKEPVDYIGADYSNDRKLYIEGYKQGEKETINRAAEWLEKWINHYINGEYNEFHHEFEYDGTVDKKKLISDFTKQLSEDDGESTLGS